MMSLFSLSRHLLLAGLVLFPSCKPMNNSELATLGDFASGGNSQNQCSGDPNNPNISNSIANQKSISVIDKISQGEKETYIGYVTKVLTSIPDPHQQIFIEAQGKVVVTDFAAEICTRASKVSSYNGFGSDRFAHTFKSKNDIDGCYVAIPSSNNLPAEVSIYIKRNKAKIDHSLVKIFGGFMSEIGFNLTVNASGQLILDPKITEQEKICLAQAFLMDIAGTKNASRFKKFANNGSRQQLAALGNSVGAEAYDNMFCNNWAQGSKNTLKQLSDFPVTRDVFWTIKNRTDACQALQKIRMARSSSISQGFSLTNEETATTEPEAEEPVFVEKPDHWADGFQDTTHRGITPIGERLFDLPNIKKSDGSNVPVWKATLDDVTSGPFAEQNKKAFFEGSPGFHKYAPKHITRDWEPKNIDKFNETSFRNKIHRFNERAAQWNNYAHPRLEWDDYKEVGEEFPARRWSRYTDQFGQSKWATKETADRYRQNLKEYQSPGMAAFNESVYQTAENTPIGPFYTYATGETPRGEKVGIGGRVFAGGVTAASIFAGPLTSRGVGALKNQVVKRTVSGSTNKAVSTGVSQGVKSADNLIGAADDLAAKVDLDDVQPFRFVSRDAETLLQKSQGAGGIVVKKNGNIPTGHAFDHIPPPGVSPAVHATMRSGKPMTTVYSRSRHAFQDMRDILNSRADEIATLKPGTEINGTLNLAKKRYGYNSVKGATAEPVVFDKVTYAISRTRDGRLHVEHFSPKLN